MQKKRTGVNPDARLKEEKDLESVFRTLAIESMKKNGEERKGKERGEAHRIRGRDMKKGERERRREGERERGKREREGERGKERERRREGEKGK